MFGTGTLASETKSEWVLTDPKKLALLANVFSTRFSQASNLGVREAGVVANLKMWNTQKAELVGMMRKHPNWDEQALGIIVPMAESRSVNEKQAFSSINGIIAAGKVNPTINLKLWGEIVSGNVFAQSVLTQRSADALNTMFDKYGVKTRFGGGQRMSRVMRKILEIFGFDESDKEAIIYFDKYAEAVNPLGYETRFVLSAHPVDYIHMSRGNSWTSCHAPGGCYQRGPFSYLLDNVSLVSYVVPSKTAMSSAEGDLPTYDIKKWTRQMYMFNSEYGFLQSRLYPKYGDINTSDKYLDAVISMYNIMLGAEHKWKTSSDMHHYSDMFENGGEGTHYPDWVHGFNCRMNYNADLEILKKLRFSQRKVIGSLPLCIICGRRIIRSGSNYTCDGCRDHLRRRTIETYPTEYSAWGLPIPEPAKEEISVVQSAPTIDGATAQLCAAC